jgi:uncharacterized protein YkwD
MLRSYRSAWFAPALVLALSAGGCYSGLDPGDSWTGASGLSTPGTGGPDGSGPGGTDGDPTEAGGSTGGGSMSGGATEDSGADTADMTTAPAGSTSGDPGTSGPDPSTGADPTNGTTTNGTTTNGTTTDGTTTNGTTTTDGGSTTSTTGEPNPDVPNGVPYCGPAATWDAAWKQKEEDILAIVNQVRAQGANCGSEGNFGPAGPLTMDPNLRCAARMHSKDMNDRDFFDHTNPDGESPWDRMDKAGYGNYSNAGENIAAGSPDAAGTMDQWMGSDGHCANIMNPDFEHIGVGYHPGGQWGHLWTQVFGAK